MAGKQAKPMDRYRNAPHTHTHAPNSLLVVADKGLQSPTQLCLQLSVATDFVPTGAAPDFYLPELKPGS